MLIPGEPLLCPPQPRLRLPGVPQRTDRHAVTATAQRLIVAFCVVVSAWWLVAWVVAPVVTSTTCVGPPDASYPTLDYRGFDGAWVYQGHIVGYTAQEDDPCLSQNPFP